MTGGVRLSGVPASPGAAVGRAFLLDSRRVQEPREHIPPERAAQEVARLHDAIARSDQQLAEIRGKLLGQPQEHALIIEAHRLMLTDPTLIGGAEALIKSDLVNAEWAVRRIVRRLRTAFDDIDDPYFRERQNDVDYVGDRIVQNLLGVPTELTEPPPADAVLVSNDLSPAEAMMLLGSGHRIAGIVTDLGGRTSHTAIVARALEVPAVLGCERASELVGQGDLIALDGTAGLVVIEPSEQDLAEIERAAGEYREEEERALATKELEARTTDGIQVTLRANIELVEEVPSIIAHGADGVGLYRTEFLFLNRKEPPTEEEHFQTYRRLLEALPGRPVTVRTFDLGGEKALAARAKPEVNPSLGLRAVRYCLAHPELFLPQLRALWRASPYGELKVMFPMVSGVSELRRARAYFERAREEVVRDGYRVAKSLPLGIMVETPAAVEVADLLAKEVSFFSVGTNDLIQYTLAIDRTNQDVAYLYQPLHPAILRMLGRAVEVGRQHGIDVALCGEMAGDPAYTLILLALGVTELSMVGNSIPRVKELLRRTSSKEAKELFQSALALAGNDEVEAYVRHEMRRRYPDLFAQPAEAHAG